MALITHPSQGQYQITLLRPQPCSQGSKRSSFITFRLVDRTTVITSLKHCSYSRPHNINTSQRKPFRILSFKGSEQNVNSDNCSKFTNPLIHADVHNHPITYSSEDKERSTTGSPSIQKLFRKWLLLLQTKTSVQGDEILSENMKVSEKLEVSQKKVALKSEAGKLLKSGVNSIDLDGRTALHIAACEGCIEVVELLLRWKANVDARDRWGSTPAADAKYYENIDVYNILKARGAKITKTRKTPMEVSNPRDVPEYEVNPMELQFRRGEDVYKGTYQVAKWNGTKVSVKVLDKDSYSDPDSIQAFKQELTMLQKVRHPNVVQFVGAVTQNIPMMIISEYHPKGDLKSYLQKKGHLHTHKALRFARHIARGMNYLHECKPEPIIHCDLQPKNILLDDAGQMKVAGFGMIKLSKLSSEKVKLARPEALARSLYMAPEVYKNEIFGKKVDSFSFGLILYEMIEGTPAFHPKSSQEAAKLICLDGLRPPLKKHSKSSIPDLKELIEECWNIDPVVRPSFTEIIVRLDKLYTTYSNKTGGWKDTFKLPWK